MNNLNIVEMEVIMKNKFEFKIKNNFYYRYPYFSYDFYSVELIKKIETIISDVKNNYMENILVSSQRLYKAISNKYNSKNLETSIYKYLLRSSVRSTPYGINAGVGLGNFNVENNFILIKDNKKRARVDVEWLVHVIKICEKKLGYDLYVTHTNCYYTSSNRLKKYYDSCYVRDEKSGDYGSSIRNTNLVKAILNLTNNYIKIYDLLDELTIKFGEENRNKIYNIIMDLLESEFLTSNLKINLLSNNPYKKLLSILDRYNFSDEIFSKLKEIDHSDYLNRISTIFQDYNNYEFTVQENIRYGDPKHEVSFETMLNAAKLTRASDFIEKLPKAYNQQVGNWFAGGVQLSGGQWQKLALARGLVKKSDVYIFDEPTSSLDPTSEFHFFKNMLEVFKNNIGLFVTHRFINAKLANKILVFKDGNIIEIGSHEDLIKNKRYYYNMYILQQEGIKTK